MTVGETILTLVTNPESAPALTRLAAAVARPVGGQVVPLSVVSRGSSDSEVQSAQDMVIGAERYAHARGVNSRGLVALDDAVDEAVLEVAEERGASLVLMGWQGRSTRRNVFGEIIDSVLGRSQVPLLITRLQGDVARWERVLLTVTPENLMRTGDTGLRLASVLAERLRRDTGSLEVLRSGDSPGPLPSEITGTFAPVHHDPRRHDLAVAAAARADDLIVLPVAPTSHGLRTATHLAWAAPDASILVAVPAARARAGSLADAVREAGTAPIDIADGESTIREHVVAITVRLPEGAAIDVQRVSDALAAVGRVSEVGVWSEDSRQCAEVMIHLFAGDQNAALGTVMTALHELPGLSGAEFRYDLNPRRTAATANGAGARSL